MPSFCRLIFLSPHFISRSMDWPITSRPDSCPGQRSDAKLPGSAKGKWWNHDFFPTMQVASGCLGRKRTIYTSLLPSVCCRRQQKSFRDDCSGVLVWFHVWVYRYMCITFPCNLQLSGSCLMSLEVLLQVLCYVIGLHGQVELANVLLKLLGSKEHAEKEPQHCRWKQVSVLLAYSK